MTSRRTKIVCTLGPASEEHIEGLITAGMNVARMNFSHGDHAEQEKRWKRLQSAIKATGKRVAILLDTQGPKVRITTFPNGGIDLHEGELVTLIPGTQEGGVDRDGHKSIYIAYPQLIPIVREHPTVHFADGAPEVHVERVEGNKAIARVVTGGRLGDRKGVNIPHASWDLPAIGPKDEKDIMWGIEHKVDYIALSFVRSADDIRKLRAILDDHGAKDIKIVAKIEEYPAVQAIDHIIAEADALMVARGDLGVQMPIEQVPAIQKMIIRKSNAAYKPVITATQMLDSMTTKPFPTRAEVSDVANAIVDGSDAVMLSDETASGRHPVRVVQMMAKIINNAEQNIFNYDRFDADTTTQRSIPFSIGAAAVRVASEVGAKAVVAYTEGGSTARSIARFRPKVPLLAVTPHEHVSRQLCLLWGTQAVTLREHDKFEDALNRAGEAALASKLVKPGDSIVVAAGVPFGKSGSTNLIKVHVV